MATIVAAALFTTSGLTAAERAHAAITHYELNIPRQPLDTALKDLAQQTGLQVGRFSDAIDGDTLVGPVTGHYSAEQALQAMLAPAGLTYRTLNERAIIVLRPQDIAQLAPANTRSTSGETAPARVLEEAAGSNDANTNEADRHSLWSRLRLAQAAPGANSGNPGPTAGNSSAALATDGAAAGPILEEVTVTAQKRAENLQRVPISVTAVNAEALAAAGINSTADLGAAVPGLHLLNVGGGLSPRLRGVGAEAVTAGAESPVAVYIDGVYYAFSSDLNVDMQDVSQVTVLKGPQGTLFGRNATGGVIQFNTRDPQQKFELEGTTSYDDWETSRSHAYVGGGITDTLAAGMSVSVTTQGRGWGKNLSDDRDIHKIGNDDTVRGKLVYDDGPTRATFSLDYRNQDDDLSYNFRPAPGYSVLLPVAQSGRLWDSNNYLKNSAFHEAAGGAVNISQDVNFAHLVSITGYRWGTYRGVFNTTATSVPSVDLIFPQLSKQFSQELQLVSNNNEALNWVLGAYYFWNKAATGPVEYNILPIDTTLVFNGRQSTTSVAPFAQGTLAVTDSTRLTAGLRYTYEDKDFAGNSITPDPIVGKLSFSKLTWRLAVDHTLAPDVLSYVSFNRGFKSGTFNTGAPGTPPVKPETLDAYELGLKTESLEHRVRANVAAFYYNYTNIQVNAFDRTSILMNAQGARIWGFDATVAAAVTDGLRVNGDVSWLPTANFRSFPNAQFSNPLPNNAGASVYTGDASGNQLPDTSKLTFTLGTDYRVDTTFGALTFNVNDSYASKFYGESDNRLFQKPAHLVNASVDWQALTGRYGVRFWATNLGNAAVASQLVTFDQSTLSGYIASYSNPPRTYGVTVHAAL